MGVLTFFLFGAKIIFVTQILMSKIALLRWLISTTLSWPLQPILCYWQKKGTRYWDWLARTTAVAELLYHDLVILFIRKSILSTCSSRDASHSLWKSNIGSIWVASWIWGWRQTNCSVQILKRILRLSLESLNPFSGENYGALEVYIWLVWLLTLRASSSFGCCTLH